MTDFADVQIVKPKSQLMAGQQQLWDASDYKNIKMEGRNVS